MSTELQSDSPVEPQPISEDPPLESQPRKRWPVITAIIVMAVMAILAVIYWLDSRNYESTDDAFIDARIVYIAPQVPGIVESLMVDENSHVKAGDPLVVINPNTVEAQLAGQQASAVQADASLSQAQAGLNSARARASQAEAMVAVPQAAVRKAAADLARLETLRRNDAGAVSGASLDSARAELATARANLNAAKRSAAEAQAGIAQASSAIDAARASRSQADARVSEARITLGQNRITAPVAGRVGAFTINRGSYVAPGTRMMALVPDDLWVTANFKETQLDRIKPGQTVDIEVDAYPDVKFTGKIVSVQPAAGQAFQLLPPQNATGNFVKVVQRVPVRISFDRSPDPLKYPVGPGMSVVPKVRVK